MEQKDLRIIKANLVYRFLPSFGWTREKVASLMKKPDISFVIPRYYDSEKDKYISMRSKHGDKLPEELNNIDFSDCDYYAIYSLNYEKDIDKEKLKDYPIV